MSGTRTRRTRSARPIGAAGLALSTTLLAGPAFAGSTTGGLPNGADLTVSVDSPVTGNTFVVPAGATTVDVPLTGTAGVATGTPNVTWIYVVDVSGSTATGCDATRTVLDCEKSAVSGLNGVVTTDGSAAAVGLAVFSSDGAAADISSAAGSELARVAKQLSQRPKPARLSQKRHEGAQLGRLQAPRRVVDAKP